MSSIFNNIDMVSRYILGTLKRFPIASFCAFIVTIILMTFVEFREMEYNQITIFSIKIAFVSTMGILLFPVLHFLHRAIWLKLFGIGVMVLYYYLLPIAIGGADIKRHLLLLLSLFFMYLWTPFINHHISNKNIWEWTQKLLIAILTTAILSLTLYFVLSQQCLV